MHIGMESKEIFSAVKILEAKEELICINSQLIRLRKITIESLG